MPEIHDDATTVSEAIPAPVPTAPAGEARSPLKRRAIRRIDQDDVPHNAVARANAGRADRALGLAKVAARIADENRAKDILLLDLRAATPLVDFFVIATAASRRTGNAIAIEVDQEMKKIGELKLGMEGSEQGRWTLIDYGDFVVHVFNEESRAYYSLEEIWGDAPRVEWRDPSAPARTPVAAEDDDDDLEPEAAVEDEATAG